jgi:hypothetical protein
VFVGIALTGAIEPHLLVAAEPELGRIQGRVLPGEDQRGLQAARGERLGDGCKLDGFGPGADDQPYVGDKQPSP